MKRVLAELAALCGSWNFSSYYVGNAPIILLVQHGGYLTPDDEIIPDRDSGCSNSTHCFWWHTCEEDTGFLRDSDQCGITTSSDSYIIEFAQCLR